MKLKRCVAILSVLLASMVTTDRLAAAETESIRSVLDCPILFTKRPNYQGIHIYDTCFQWHPGGGIYVLENPADPPSEHRVRAVIDPTTPETLGEGVYCDPDLSYDATKVLFSFKGEAAGSTSIYEIGIDGTGLRRLTQAEECDECNLGKRPGVHDLNPAYLPDGRIIFTSTRYNGLVPCADVGVAILHVMNADGSDIHPISVNSETEFDPSMMEDGRILFGRWEYIDKTALTQQSLWTVYPDGTNETALYANNMVFPEATLDARQVPDAPQFVCASFTPHNSTPRGCIAMIDTRMGKNDPAAIFNFDTPDNPTNNRGNSCEPWPLSVDTVLYSTMVDGVNQLMLVHRNPDDSLTRETVYRDAIDCHTPIPVRPRPVPQLRPVYADRTQTTGAFSVQDIYEGMPEVRRGSIKQLRVIEETSRISASPGSSIYNQTFSVSAALAFACKNYLGVVPVEQDGSAHFEVPAGKAIYLQALDAEGRCVRSMRTFIQASPGTTRSCIGCHEDKKATFPAKKTATLAQRRSPDQLQDESWGTGPMDYASMVQPILDRHCVACHGGEGGIASGLDLSGGWTDFFSISYENLTSRREVQYKSTLIAGVDCMNGTALYSTQIFPAYAIGSPAAPLGKVLVDGDRGHDDRFAGMTRAERDLLLAWIDSNGLYNGTWDYTDQGCRLANWQDTKSQLIAEMQNAGCTECHDSKQRFEADWFNLEHPEWSRILRAPMAKATIATNGEGDGDPASGNSLGLGLCRAKKVEPGFRRLRIMSTGRYQHAVMPLDDFPAQEWHEWDESGEPFVSFKSTDSEAYQRMLDIIRNAQAIALASPRVDMPGAKPHAGENRNIYPIPLPRLPLEVVAEQTPDGLVELSWPRNRHTWGLTFDVYRGDSPEFMIGPDSHIATTMLCRYVDETDLKPGEYYYAVVCDNKVERSEPIFRSVPVMPLPTPGKVTGLKAASAPGSVKLSWKPVAMPGVRYYVMKHVDDELVPLNPEPQLATTFVVQALTPHSEQLEPCLYCVCAANRQGKIGPASEMVEAVPGKIPTEPIVDASKTMPEDGVLEASAKFDEGTFDFTQGGHVTLSNNELCNLNSGMPGLTVECKVRLTGETKMPVVISAGRWNSAGWFLQQIGGRWRWHVGGVDCDGGKATKLGEWTQITATFDGQHSRLYQDGTLVADVPCSPNRNPWDGKLMIGQYSGGPGADYQVIGQMAEVKIYAYAKEPAR